jgi:hypothetical protein
MAGASTAMTMENPTVLPLQSLPFATTGAW